MPICNQTCYFGLSHACVVTDRIGLSLITRDDQDMGPFDEKGVGKNAKRVSSVLNAFQTRVKARLNAFGVETRLELSYSLLHQEGHILIMKKDGDWRKWWCPSRMGTSSDIIPGRITVIVNNLAKGAPSWRCSFQTDLPGRFCCMRDSSRQQLCWKPAPGK